MDGATLQQNDLKTKIWTWKVVFYTPTHKGWKQKQTGVCHHSQQPLDRNNPCVHLQMTVWQFVIYAIRKSPTERKFWHATWWVSLEDTVLSEISQLQNCKCCEPSSPSHKSKVGRGFEEAGYGMWESVLNECGIWWEDGSFWRWVDGTDNCIVLWMHPMPLM